MVTSRLQTRNTENRPKKFEDVALQVLLDEDDSQTQKQFAEQLSISQQAVSKRAQEMVKIQKSGRWVPDELNDMEMEKGKQLWHFARSVQKEVVFPNLTCFLKEKTLISYMVLPSYV